MCQKCIYANNLCSGLHSTVQINRAYCAGQEYESCKIFKDIIASLIRFQDEGHSIEELAEGECLA